MIIPYDRITPKFRDSINFRNILSFLTEYDSTSIDALNDMSNIDSDNGFILDEIGKTLGIYPRPLVPLVILGNNSFFTYDASAYDTVPYLYTTGGSYRDMSNQEYSKLLRVFAMGLSFRGTIQEWEDIIFVLTGARVSFSNGASTFSLVIYKDLSVIEKAIVDYALRYNSLTVNIDLAGTTTSPQVFKYDVAQYDKSVYIKPW